MEESLSTFDWRVQPEADRLVHELLEDFVEKSDFVRSFRQRLLSETGTRLIDWVDSIHLPADSRLAMRLKEAGFEEEDGEGVYSHPGGLFPRVRCHSGDERQLFLKVESVADFLSAQQREKAAIAGESLASLRLAQVSDIEGAECWVIERHGDRGFEPPEITENESLAVLHHSSQLHLRQRDFEDAHEGFEYARQLIAAASKELPIDRVCDLFFAAERDYWQSRNRAARVQKARQDALGLGWANHDHHTYRCGREFFRSLIEILEQLGFTCRERFYAGREAGWGAQVLEQPRAEITVFADVDLSPEEVAGDFAHEPLPRRDSLGTVGLWCRLHGEAFLEAGMHHLECQFDFDAAREQLDADGVASMKPFTDFDFLRQSFTQGEQWPVAESRIQSLLADGLISEAEAATFRKEGALGSHLEVLERNEGFKGFNQTGINEIILATDPRHSK
ncbi:MAG TPA: hypothetical protein VMM56_06040 [Planctomycetaceae bacterium]|nr:hypothetical protein [Planctomycetaceae bacterium]